MNRDQRTMNAKKDQILPLRMEERGEIETK